MRKIAVLFLVSALLLSGCADDEKEYSVPESRTEASVRDVADDTTEYLTAEVAEATGATEATEVTAAQSADTSSETVVVPHFLRPSDMTASTADTVPPVQTEVPPDKELPDEVEELKRLVLFDGEYCEVGDMDISVTSVDTDFSALGEYSLLSDIDMPRDVTEVDEGGAFDRGYEGELPRLRFVKDGQLYYVLENDERTFSIIAVDCSDGTAREFMRFGGTADTAYWLWRFNEYGLLISEYNGSERCLKHISLDGTVTVVDRDVLEDHISLELYDGGIYFDNEEGIRCVRRYDIATGEVTMYRFNAHYPRLGHDGVVCTSDDPTVPSHVFSEYKGWSNIEGYTRSPLLMGMMIRDESTIRSFSYAGFGEDGAYDIAEVLHSGSKTYLQLLPVLTDDGLFAVGGADRDGNTYIAVADITAEKITCIDLEGQGYVRLLRESDAIYVVMDSGIITVKRGEIG
ncbi:MAG: hypothetical protein J6A16_07950 [Oscillospiraceae bacterium]|nr:hypothetical protein [Oscillospiraceae bacterium]